MRNRSWDPTVTPVQQRVRLWRSAKQQGQQLAARKLVPCSAAAARGWRTGCLRGAGLLVLPETAVCRVHSMHVDNTGSLLLNVSESAHLGSSLGSGPRRFPPRGRHMKCQEWVVGDLGQHARPAKWRCV